MKLSPLFSLAVLFITSVGFSVCEKIGPIPVIDCMKGKLIPTHHEGKRVERRGGKFFLDGTLAHNFSPKTVDRPSLATNGMTGGINGRLGHLKTSGIDWVFICRTESEGVDEDHYRYEPVGLIGFNSATGETCFTDMKANGAPSSNTEAENTEYCARCHSNNSPWILTPYLNQSALGGDGSMDLIPVLPKEKLSKPGWGYKIYGISESFRKTLVGIQPKNPDGTLDTTCTSCHTISNSFTDHLYDAVGRNSENAAKTALAKKFSLNYWMPSDPLVLNKSQWDEKYGAAVERLLYCVKRDDPSRCAKRVELVLPAE